MKTIILTQDYEIFFGKPSGTVDKCMILPTEYLTDVLSRYKSKMTVFWDIMHYYTLLQNVNLYNELNSDILSINNQIKKLLSYGHDIQLHIHPHWLDAKYSGNHQWEFTYSRYSIHNLKNTYSDKVDTINGCISNCIRILKEFDNNTDKLLIFRAGGYHIEPFDEIKEAFIKNRIYYDSSTIKPINNNKNERFYRFSNTTKIAETDGMFYEFPITSLKISLLRNIYFKYLRNRYLNIEKFGDGNSIYGSIKDNNILLKYFGKTPNKTTDKIFNLFKKRDVVLTPEGSFREKFMYLIRKTPDESLMTLHPKNLNYHQLELLNDVLKNKIIRFISLSDYIRRTNLIKK